MDDWIAAWYNVTPFVSASRTIQPSFSDPFYTTERYQRFIRFLSEEAASHNVTLKKITKTIGLWQGSHEPSVSVKVEGRRGDIEFVAALLLGAFSQKSVSIVYQPGSSEHLTYRFSLPVDEPVDILRSLVASGVAGAHLTPKEVRLNESTVLDRKVLETLVRLYGDIHVSPCEVVRILA